MPATRWYWISLMISVSVNWQPSSQHGTSNSQARVAGLQASPCPGWVEVLPPAVASLLLTPALVLAPSGASDGQRTRLSEALRARLAERDLG